MHANDELPKRRAVTPTNRFIMQKVSRNKWVHRATDYDCRLASIIETILKVNAQRCVDARIYHEMIVIYGVVESGLKLLYGKMSVLSI